MIYDLIVIGGGAAGFYGAIQAAELKKGLNVLIFEKSTKLLSKVKVSGGGRCNVTHNCPDANSLSKHYPRGEKPLRNIFRSYHSLHTIKWFHSKGVKLKVEQDGRMFPDSDDSQTIINCFLKTAQDLKIKIEAGNGVTSIEKNGGHFTINTTNDTKYSASNVLITIGGNASENHYSLLKSIGHNVIPPIASLFTFNDTDKRFKDLMGVSVPNAEVKITSTKFSNSGPLLITHWGLSGPAVIKLSAWAAVYLHQQNYDFNCMVNWLGTIKEEELRSYLLEHKRDRGKQHVVNNTLFNLPLRLWNRFCELAEIEPKKIWSEVPNKNINKLIENLIRCSFRIKGKTTFKEEFVTCGGIDLNEINHETMESKIVNGIYFAGEVLNIDGETGGFNFQAAWSTAYMAAKAIVAPTTQLHN
ncbi:NAD(P)/FAD-dependent oxidoreductase [Chryseosolibacter indicus]|uniref:NAD(P)/FAD-dependent oxidoreductase n=1 Tax=Chryseosolibacter indicus TaxID=2782351 RepID=A0ABS5VWP2_9BACT|nr:NAD(P)/FAD-dependent oxidoreductase [Chryseosolibacter indicus]MBT1705473.1 NAD(P)/FAD-dependent oxidoreductase [Chryseosolibacter indicus]